MTSEKQKKANKKNAKKSTGPKTKSGKKRSSQNAIRHGVLTDFVGNYPQEKEAFRAFHKQILKELQPKGQIETLLVERYSLNFWRERRLSYYEEKLLKKYRTEVTFDKLRSEDPDIERLANADLLADMGPLNETPIEKQLLIARYQTMLSNQSRSLLKELREEQWQRMNSGKIIDEKGNAIG